MWPCPSANLPQRAARGRRQGAGIATSLSSGDYPFANGCRLEEPTGVSERYIFPILNLYNSTDSAEISHSTWQFPFILGSVMKQDFYYGTHYGTDRTLPKNWTVKSLRILNLKLHLTINGNNPHFSQFFPLITARVIISPHTTKSLMGNRSMEKSLVYANIFQYLRGKKAAIRHSTV